MLKKTPQNPLQKGLTRPSRIPQRTSCAAPGRRSPLPPRASVSSLSGNSAGSAPGPPHAPQPGGSPPAPPGTDLRPLQPPSSAAGREAEGGGGSGGRGAPGTARHGSARPAGRCSFAAALGPAQCCPGTAACSRPRRIPAPAGGNAGGRKGEGCRSGAIRGFGDRREGGGAGGSNAGEVVQ